MPKLRNKKTGLEEFVPPELLRSAIASGIYENPGEDLQVQVSTEEGIGSTTLGDLERIQSVQGDVGLESTESRAARAHREILERRHSGIGEKITTGLEGAASGVSLGLYDVAAEAIASDEYVEDMRGRALVNPTIRTASEVAGAVGPGFAGSLGKAGTVLRSTPAGIATRIGERVAGETTESLLRTAARRGLGYGIEGAVFSSGQVLSESVLQDKELTAESVLAGAGQGLVFGGAAGAGTALLGAGLSKIQKVAENKATERVRAALEKSNQKKLKALEREALREKRHAEKLHLEQVRTANRTQAQALRTQGQLTVANVKAADRARVEAIRAEGRHAVASERRVGVQATAAERRVGVEATAAARVQSAEIGASAKVKAAEARAAVARSKADKAASRIELEKVRQEGRMETLAARQKLADTYTDGWKAANDRKIEAARLRAQGQSDMATAGLASAIAKAGKADAGISISEIVPKRLRSPRAIERAQQAVQTQADTLRFAGDDLLRKADDIAIGNPAVASELQAARASVARASDDVRSWSAASVNGVDDFATGAAAIGRMEEAQLDLAQKLRPYLDDVSGASVDEQMRPMLDALESQSVAHNDQVMRAADAYQKNSTLDYVAMADVASEAAGSDLLPVEDVPVVGPVLSAYLKLHAAKAALNKVGARIAGPGAEMARSVANFQNRSSEAVARLVATGTKKLGAGLDTGRRAIPAAASILGRPLYDEQPRSRRAKEVSLEEAYKQRLDELSRAIANMQGVRGNVHSTVAAPPALRDAIANAVVRKLTYLHEKAPKDPDPSGLYESDWVPSREELKSFARTVQAVNDPLSVLRDVETGEVSLEAVEALKAVYPRIYQQMQEELVEHMSELRERLPFDRRIYISHLFEVAVDPSMADDFVASMQEASANERQPAEQGAPSGGVAKLAEAATLGMNRRAAR